MQVELTVETPTTPRSILARERELFAFECRKKGWSYQRIADNLHVSDVAVSKMIKRCLERGLSKTQEAVEHVRALECQRLDQLIEAHWDFAMKGDDKSSAVILRCMDRRASYLGLDAPKQVEVTEKSDIDQQIDGLIERMRNAGLSGKRPITGGQVPVTVEITGEAQPVDAGGPVALLAGYGGTGIRENAGLPDSDTDADRLDDHRAPL